MSTAMSSRWWSEYTPSSVALHRSSRSRSGEPGPKMPRSRVRPSLMSWPLFSTRPSVYSTNRLPSSTLNWRLSTSPSPMPSGGGGGPPLPPGAGKDAQHGAAREGRQEQQGGAGEQLGHRVAPPRLGDLVGLALADR